MTTQPQNHIAPQPNVAIRPARPDDGPALAVVMAARGGTPSDHAPAAHWLLDRAPVLVVAEAALPELLESGGLQPLQPGAALREVQLRAVQLLRCLLYTSPSPRD